MSDLKYIAENGTVEITATKLFLRSGAPKTSVSKVKFYSTGEKVQYVGYVTNGDSVSGNSKWYKTAKGNYFWSGGVKPVSVEKKVEPAKSGGTSSISAAVGSGCPNHKADVLLVQTLLKKKGVSVGVDGAFGPNTASAIKNFQKGALKFSSADGKVDVGGKTWQGLNDSSVVYTKPAASTGQFDEKYKDVTIQGSVFPDAPIRSSLKISLKPEMTSEYIPAMEKALAGSPKGLKYLCTIMAHKEGYFKGSRSYRTNNPGNIGNTDSGRNRSNSTLEDGILLQRDYINKIIAGKHSAFPMGKKKVIPPYYSPEIAKHPSYGMSPYLPGYEFVFTGQLDQFVKIYSTGARGGNGYLSMIISYFNSKGIKLTEKSTLSEIVKIA